MSTLDKETAALLLKAAEVCKGEQEIKPYTYYDVEGLWTLPPPEWAVKDLIPGKRLFSIYAPSASFKTFLALNLALHMSTGLSFAERKTKQARVVYILGEGEADLVYRIGAWQAKYGVSNADLKKWFIAIPHRIPLDDPDSFARLLATLDNVAHALGPVGMLFVDTLNRCMIGDENSARDMSRFIGSCDHIRERYSCGVCIVHHTGKTSETSRGSSALPAALDGEFFVRREKGKMHIAFSATKLRCGRDNVSEQFVLEEKAFVTLDGFPAAQLVAVHTAKVDENCSEASAPFVATPHDALLLRIYREMPSKQQDLVSVELGKVKISRLLKKLRDLCYIEQESLAINADGMKRLRELHILLGLDKMERGTEIDG